MNDKKIINPSKLRGKALMSQAPKDINVDNYYEHMPNICQWYANYMPGVIPGLLVQDNYLKQRYAEDMPRYGQDNYL